MHSEGLVQVLVRALCVYYVLRGAREETWHRAGGGRQVVVPVKERRGGPR